MPDTKPTTNMLQITASIPLPEGTFESAAVLTSVRGPIDDASESIRQVIGNPDFRFETAVVQVKPPRAPRGSKKATAARPAADKSADKDKQNGAGAPAQH